MTVRDVPASLPLNLFFNRFGQRASVWDATDGWQSQGQTYWGSAPVEFYNNGYAHYQHQDWLGTERMVTSNTAQTGRLLDLKTIKTILGYKHRPWIRKRGWQSRLTTFPEGAGSDQKTQFDVRTWPVLPLQIDFTVERSITFRFDRKGLDDSTNARVSRFQ